MTTILNGLLGGAVVGVLATVAAYLSNRREAAETGDSGGRNTSPTARTVAYLLLVVYGSVVGGILVALELFVLDVLSVPPTADEAFAVGIAWGVVLLGVALVVRRYTPRIQSERPGLTALLVYHMVYGFGLGVWIRLTWVT